MLDCKPYATPMTSNLHLSATGSAAFEDPSLYRSMVGSLQYITITRPKLSFCVNKVCQFMQNPLEPHWKAVKRILRYLSGTSSFGLHFRPTSTLSLTGFSDSDWGSDMDDRKSTSGYCIYLGDNLISWSSKKQHAVSHSSTEAEFRGLASAVAELIWIRSLLCELQVTLHTPPKLLCDNISAMLLAANPILHTRTKHFELDLHFVRDSILKHKITLSHIPGPDQIADVLTKAVSSSSFHKFRTKLCIENSHMLSLRGDVRNRDRNEVRNGS